VLLPAADPPVAQELNQLMDEARPNERRSSEETGDDDEPRRPARGRAALALLLLLVPAPFLSMQTLSAQPVSSQLFPGLGALDAGPASPWPEILLLGGLLLTLLTGVFAHALVQFSPARLVQRLERRFADREDGELELERIGEELDDAERYAPALWLLQLLGLGAAVYGIVGVREHPLWPDGFLGFVLLFFVAALLAAYLPDRFARTRAEAIVWRSLPLLRLLHWITLPLTWPLLLISLFLVRNLMGMRTQEDGSSEGEDLADEIRAAVEDKDEHESLADEAKDWIENIVDFRDEDVAGVMTPRTDIIGIDASKSFLEAVQIASEAGHSRLPVFDETLDHIVGIFYLRDAVRTLLSDDPRDLERRVSEHVREAYFVPESKGIGDLFREFKSRRLHIAIVVDEYGGTSGVVSLEDVIEEIVGEIVDEYDDGEEPTLRVVDKGKTIEVDARFHVNDLNEELTVEVPESDDYETIGGWVFSHLGRIPQAGDRFETEELEITILSADPRRIERLRVKVLDREKNSS
jgi:putative hemolysin